MYVTENGTPLPDAPGPDGAVHDPVRLRYVARHAGAVRQAVTDGADMRGYFLWSFLDNFEWGFGFTKRFGVTWVDYPTQKRVLKDSGRWYAKAARENGFPVRRRRPWIASQWRARRLRNGSTGIWSARRSTGRPTSSSGTGLKPFAGGCTKAFRKVSTTGGTRTGNGFPSRKATKCSTGSSTSTSGSTVPGQEISLRVHMNPSFPEEIIGRQDDRTLVRDSGGVVAERYLTDVEESSIPHFISFPVKNRADWEDLRRRYRSADPTRRFPESQLARLRTAIADGKMVTAGMAGFYGQLRNWMGFEHLSLCFYDDPGLVESMVGTWADLCVEQIRKLPGDIPIDYLSWWEDMASKNGPFVSPEQFRRFFLPAYSRVMDEVRRRGCILSIVDCDGNPGALVPLWLEAGVNILFPLEVKAASIPSHGGGCMERISF